MRPYAGWSVTGADAATLAPAVAFTGSAARAAPVAAIPAIVLRVLLLFPNLSAPPCSLLLRILLDLHDLGR